MTDTLTLTWTDVEERVDNLIARRNLRNLVQAGDVKDVYGIPRGGVAPALMVAGKLGLSMTTDPCARTLIVDDLIDSGATMARTVVGLRTPPLLTLALYRKSWSPLAHAVGALELAGDPWVVFPWEGGEGSPEDAVVRLLSWIGEDPAREGLVDTPKRVTKALREMTWGMSADPTVILGTTFGDTCDEMIVVSPIEFTSKCEHHMLPFTGTATVGYVPGNRVVGLSKIPRLVDAFAARLQIQERLTNQIADAMDEVLKPRGVGVILTAHHTCMSCRGVRKLGTQMTTSAMRGFMKDDPKARAEFLTFR